MNSCNNWSGLLVWSIGAKMLWELRSIFLLPQSWAWHHNWHVGLHCQKVCTVACYYWYCICALWNVDVGISFVKCILGKIGHENMNSFKAFLLQNLFYSSFFASTLYIFHFIKMLFTADRRSQPFHFLFCNLTNYATYSRVSWRIF